MYMLKNYSSILLLLALAACTTATKSNPARTATEQMLISAAADRAAAELTVQLAPGTTGFIDVTNFDGTDSKYAIGAIRAHLLTQGVYIVDDKKKAQTIIELRSGALSTDTSETLVGIPSFAIPVPLSSGSLTTPEIALYKDTEQKGVAKFAATAYDAKKGSLLTAQDPQYGFSHKTKKTVLIFVTWTDEDGLPDDDKDVTLSHPETVVPNIPATK
jgi:hypothetical protein